MSVALALLLAAAPPLPIVTTPDQIFAVVGQSQRPTVVHFWATWCESCVRELPAIRQLGQRLQHLGSPLLLISLDSPDRLATVAAFVEARRLLTPPSGQALLLDAPDPGPLTARFDPTWDAKLPATFVVLQSGVVAASHLGHTPVSTIVEEVRTLTNAGDPPPARRMK